MADFYFKFFPGEYLRDTQCLSTNAQVAYDRIMCEHMRNICISKEQHKFFTKRMSDDEIFELNTVLTKNECGYCIQWVVDSIVKARAYNETRGKNSKGKGKENTPNHMISYDKHPKSKSNNKSNSIKIEKEDSEKDVNYPFDLFWDLYEKKVGDRVKVKKKWDSLTDHERYQATLHIPEYKKAQPDKQYRKDPFSYLHNKSFNDEIIYKNGQQATTTGGKPGNGGNGADFFANIIHENTGG